MFLYINQHEQLQTKQIFAGSAFTFPQIEKNASHYLYLP